MTTNGTRTFLRALTHGHVQQLNAVLRQTLIALTERAPLLPGAQEVVFVVRHSDPPATLSLDEILDETPLSDSGQQRAKMLAERLKDAGIPAEMKRYAGMPHGFLSFGAALDGSKEAMADAALRLRSAFGLEAAHAATTG